MKDIELPPLPERDTSKPAEEQGVFRKFDVRRTDGSSEPGGKHHGCEYFVLDVDHDPAAHAALAAYADAIEATHPVLAADMRSRYVLTSAAVEADRAQRVPDRWKPASGMTAHRAAFFMERFKREEKLLGPNEQAAVDFVLAMLASTPAQPAPQPVERKPMTDAEIEDLCGEANRGFCIELEDYKKAVQDTERHHGIKE